MLRTALQNSSSMVMSGHLQEQESQFIKPHAYFDTNPVGYVNFVAEDPTGSVIRYFRPATLIGQDTVWSFSMLALKKINETKFKQLERKYLKTLTINYKGNHEQFISLEGNAVLGGKHDLENLKNKVVLLGFMGDELGDKKSLEDIHFSPLNGKFTGKSMPDMYGVVIHANIISMLLNDTTITKTPLWLDILFAIVLCYVHVVVFLYFFAKRHLWYHVVAKFSILITSILLLFILFTLYSSAHIKVNTGIILLSIVLSVDVLYLYEVLAAILYKKKGIKSYLIHE